MSWLDPHRSHRTHNLVRRESKRLLIWGCAAMAWGLCGNRVHFDGLFELLWPLITRWVILSRPIQQQSSYSRGSSSRTFYWEELFHLGSWRDPKSSLGMGRVVPSVSWVFLSWGEKANLPLGLMTSQQLQSGHDWLFSAMTECYQVDWLFLKRYGCFKRCKLQKTELLAQILKTNKEDLI